MNKLVELAGGKPSDVIKAMIAGLEESGLWSRFIVDMNSSGYQDAGFCYGCAGTCTVLHLNKTIKKFDFSFFKLGIDYSIDETKIQVDQNTVWAVIESVDRLRQGHWRKFLYKLWGIIPEDGRFIPKVKLHKLENLYWQYNLEPYRLYAKQLEDIGL